MMKRLIVLNVKHASYPFNPTWFIGFSWISVQIQTPPTAHTSNRGSYFL